MWPGATPGRRSRRARGSPQPLEPFQPAVGEQWTLDRRGSVQSGEAANTRASQQSHDDGFNLVIASVARDNVRVLQRRDASKESPASLPPRRFAWTTERETLRDCRQSKASGTGNRASRGFRSGCAGSVINAGHDDAMLWTTQPRHDVKQHRGVRTS